MHVDSNLLPAMPLVSDSNFRAPQSPLTLHDIQLIEATDLSSLERHHLRLLAHCLVCFQTMAQGSSDLPGEKIWLQWCLDQPGLSSEKRFISVLLEQFAAAARQLEEIALNFNIPPMELTLEHLIMASVKASDHSEGVA